MDWVFRQNHHQSTKQRQGCKKIPEVHYQLLVISYQLFEKANNVSLD